MKMKSKFDYEIDHFRTTFQDKKDMKIVLYGTGRMTATLVSGISDFQIIGLCDRDNNLIGKEIYGLPILNRSQVEQLADCIIINTSETYWETIYQRIKKWDIPIYFLNGELAKEYSDEEKDEPYWNKSYNELRKLIDQYDIISFDVFDTLVMRKVMMPIDVFRLVEIQLDNEKKTKTNYMMIRKKSSALLQEPTLDEIYVKMSELTGLPQEEIENWKRREIETEKSLLVAREDIIQLCKEVIAEKSIYFITDMYYSSEILQNILEYVGLKVNQEQIIVSCEQRKTKDDGGLWDYYKKNIVGEKKALHIGDNIKADVQNAEKYGISTYGIWNAYQMMQRSSIKKIEVTIESLYSSLAMGLICAKIFNSPFALNRTKGKIEFINDEDAGYCILGSLMYSFMEWLICKAKEDNIKNLVFFSREGYLLVSIYKYLKKIKKEINIPEPIYLEISRRVVWNASIVKEDDIYQIAKFPYGGNLRQFLQERFGVEVKQGDFLEVSVSEKQKNVGELKKILSPYKEQILQRSCLERNNYQMYFDSLNIKEKYAIVDSQFYGSTQYYLSKMLKKYLKGYYFCVCIEPENSCLCNNEMDGCFMGDNLKGISQTKAEDTYVHKQAQFLEAFFTAPEGMLEYIEVDGKKKYADKMSNQKFFDIRLKMEKGIKQFICEMVTIQKVLKIEEKDEMWSDTLFGGFMNRGFTPSNEMKNSFYFDNRIINQREMPIWE